jgi:hypothetical protein
MGIDKLFWMNNEVQRIIEESSISKKMLEDSMYHQTINSIIDAHLPQKRLLESIESLYSIKQEYLMELGTLSTNAAIIFKDNLPSVNLLSEQILEMQQVLLKDQFIFTNAIKDTVENIAGCMILPNERINQALAGIAAISKEFVIPDLTIEYAIKNTQQYQNFVHNQFLKMKNEPADAAKRRAIVMDLSGEIFDDTGEAIEAGMIMNEGEDTDPEEIESPETEPNLFPRLNQHLGYVYKHKTKINPSEAFNKALPTRIARLGLALVLLVIDINQFSERGEKKEIFKPTTRNMKACAELPTLIANDEDTFGKVTDALYFLLYEGSGYAARLLNIVDEEVLEPMWWLKKLRTDFRHDVGHGNQSKIQSALKNTGDTYKRLIGCARPRYNRDWGAAQLALYEDLFCMLNKIYETQS